VLCTVYCVLPTAYCVLRTAYCVLCTVLYCPTDEIFPTDILVFVLCIRCMPREKRAETREASRNERSERSVWHKHLAEAFCTSVWHSGAGGVCYQCSACLLHCEVQRVLALAPSPPIPHSHQPRVAGDATPPTIGATYRYLHPTVIRMVGNAPQRCGAVAVGSVCVVGGGSRGLERTRHLGADITFHGRA
jgi:hypothetical protein